MTTPTRLPVVAVALVLAALALAPAPGTAQQVSRRTVELANEGFTALGAGDLESARRAFERALERERNEPLLYLGLGVVAYQQQETAEARRHLDRALRLDPSLADAQILLARMRYEDGDLFGAIRELEQATILLPDDEDLAKELESWRQELALQNDMNQSLSDHFTVSYEGPPEEGLTLWALEVLDRAYWRLGQELSVYPLRPVPVVLYTLERLTGPFGVLSDSEAALAYATSELAVRRLLSEVGGIAMANLLRDLGQGVPLAQAFEHRLYRSLDQFLASGFWSSMGRRPAQRKNSLMGRPT